MKWRDRWLDALLSSADPRHVSSLSAFRRRSWALVHHLLLLYAYLVSKFPPLLVLSFFLNGTDLRVRTSNSCSCSRRRLPLPLVAALPTLSSYLSYLSKHVSLSFKLRFDICPSVHTSRSLIVASNTRSSLLSPLLLTPVPPVVHLARSLSHFLPSSLFSIPCSPSLLHSPRPSLFDAFLFSLSLKKVFREKHMRWCIELDR